jgi:serine/threonine protein kinase
MDTRSWERAKQIIAEALTLPPRDRDVFVRARSGGDGTLCAEMLALLAQHDPAWDFLEARAPREEPDLLADLSPATRVSDTSTVTVAENHRRPSGALIDRVRFIPGAMLAGRYRIVSLLGRGGMGEVYRAEDLKLGQPVALKFLPKAVAHRAELLSRLHNEVRVARRVSHPHVCRVYDIGEIDGEHFLSMEYVDGEDLASLLRRIGRLPPAKALELARQLCAGLAAAHDRGVLHRDLKPLNVLIDGRGRVRIVDFGLAGLANERHDPDVVAGTPDYMAPEQFTGRETSTRTDIYALGLVLYEMFTGKQPFQVVGGNLLAPVADRSPVISPSSLSPDLDPTVERVILWCLARDPALRPSSALAVAAALPGGDPLAAALAAGETPSPEMIAAAGDVGSLSPARGLAYLAVIVIGLSPSSGCRRGRPWPAWSRWRKDRKCSSSGRARSRETLATPIGRQTKHSVTRVTSTISSTSGNTIGQRRVGKC